MAPTDRLRIGIIGVGIIAFISHIPAIRASDRAELVAISRRNPEALAEAKDVLGTVEAYTDWREMLDRSRLDAVIVATSHASHAEPTIAALEKGLPVLVEKPIAATSKDAWEMARVAERTGKTLTVGYGNRLRGVWRTAKRLLDEGAIGAVEQVHLVAAQDIRWMSESDTMPQPFFEWLRTHGVPPGCLPRNLAGYWRQDPEQMGGGLFADNGSHTCSIALWLGGAPATTVVALSEPMGKAAERYITATARLANGVIASVSMNNSTDLGNTSLVIGEKGTLSVVAKSGGTELWLQQGGKREQVVFADEGMTPVASFLATVLDGAPNLSLAEDAAHVVEFTEAAYRSALDERVVTIELAGPSGAVSSSAAA